MDKSVKTRRDFLKAVGLGAVSMTIGGCAEGNGLWPAKKAVKRPNILVIFSDDQRFDSIHALGNKDIYTPNLDSLVRDGTTFTNAYLMGSMSGQPVSPAGQCC